MNAMPFILLQGGRQSAAGWATRAPAPSMPPLPSKAVTARLLGEFASLLLLVPGEAGVGKAAELDGELFDAIQAAGEADRAAERAMEGIDSISWTDPALDHALAGAVPFLLEYDAALDRAAELPARTPEGLRAKAGLLLDQVATGQDCGSLAASLARDVLGRNGA